MMFKWLHKEKKDKEFEKDIFSDICGYQDIKQILYSLIRTKESIAILLDGSAGTGKSMMLRDIQKAFPEQSRYIDGSKMTKAGLFTMLKEDFRNEIKYLIIDEIDKLSTEDQEALLTLIEDGRIIQTQKNGTFTKEYKGLKVIAASNNKYELMGPLLTRFYKVKIREYTREEFVEIAYKVLENYELDLGVVYYIVEKVLETKRKPNLRDVKHIAKLCNNSINMVDILIRNSTGEDDDDDEIQ